jgi:EAL domain-containing protein (putative c-di-GMP-specific phosphodiesterase class I)
MTTQAVPADVVERGSPSELAQLLRGEGLRAVYQPIVELATGDVVAYEALARGPAGSWFESPAHLFAAARAAGEIGALDWACRTAAVQGAYDVGLRAPISLFVNVEPAALGTPCPDHLRGPMDAAIELPIVVEFTEHALVDDPAAVLAAADRMRHRGWGVALDDVGADPGSLALMPFLAPDVVKLDLRLVQSRTTAEVATIANSVMAQVERTGAVILAEGIETEEHLERARTLGATLGQGWFFGRPQPLPAGPADTRSRRVARATQPSVRLRTPFEVAGHRPTRTATKALLLPLSRHLERQAAQLPEPPVVLATFQREHHLTSQTARRYHELGARCSIVALLGEGIADVPVPGVRGVALCPDDALVEEWVVVVVGAHFAGALVGRDLGDTGADEERRFDFVVTHDRDLVLAVARSLLERVGPV